MSRRFTTVGFVVLALAMGLILPQVALAQNPRAIFGAGRGDQDQAHEAVRTGKQVSLSRILQTIAARNPGRHLNTTLGESGGRTAYFIQWQLDDGQVVVFVVDAEKGQILGRQGG